MPTRRLDVGAEAAGERLDAFLAGPLGSRSRAQRLIEAGAVRVDGGVRPKNHRLGGGERLEVNETDPAPVEPAPVDLKVAYEDDAVLVVDKPAGVVVHGRAGLIDAPIGRDRRTRTQMSTDTDAPREARTRFAVQRTFGKVAALLRVTLETG